MTPSVPSEPMNTSLQRIARDVLHALVACPKELAVWQDDFQAHDVIARDAVFQAAQPAGILRHIAANGGDLHRAGIRRIKQACLGRRVRDALRCRPGLGKKREVGSVQFEDSVHLSQAKDDASWARNAASAQPGS